MAKNRTLGNNIIFLQHFFNFGGGGERSLSPPGGPHVHIRIVEISILKNTLHYISLSLRNPKYRLCQDLKIQEAIAIF